MRKVLFGSVISFGLLGASIAHAETPATTLYDANNEIIGSINSLGNIGNTSGPYENHYVFKLENTSDELIYIKLNDPNYIPGFNGYDTDYELTIEANSTMYITKKLTDFDPTIPQIFEQLQPGNGVSINFGTLSIDENIFDTSIVGGEWDPLAFIIEYETNANTSAIEGNDSDISDNSDAITDNKTAIESNDSDIADNKTAIEGNDTDIADNKTAIESNDSDIADNKTAIESNDSDIADNKTAIEGNDTDIADNKTAIESNDSDIADNKTAIEGNDTDISDNSDAITDNKTAIEGNDTDISDLEILLTTTSNSLDTSNDMIEQNTQGIASNSVKIGNNAQAIADSMAFGMVQQDVNYEGLQLSIGSASYDGYSGFAIVGGAKVSNDIFINFGATASGNFAGSANFKF